MSILAIMVDESYKVLKALSSKSFTKLSFRKAVTRRPVQNVSCKVRKNKAFQTMDLDLLFSRVKTSNHICKILGLQKNQNLLILRKPK